VSETPGSEFFWSIIERAKKDPERLRAILSEISEEEIVRFHEDWVTTTAELKSEPFLEHMVESEDAIDDVADWVVSQGRKRYERVLKKPSSIPQEVDEDDETNLAGIAAEVFDERFGKLLPSY
jgi:TFIIF-interacting CTD phosphatase-like protein